MKFAIDSKVLAFILLNSLLKTPEWEIFKSSLINTVEESNLTFNAIETRIIAEDARLHPSGHSEYAMKASGAPKASARPPNASTWCEHHLSSTHNSADCKSYQKWVTELRKGEFRKMDKGKEKANTAEGTLDPSDSANVVCEHVPKSLIHRIHAYSLSEQNDSGRDTLIIDSGTSSPMVPHRSWFRTYQPLHPPRPVTLGDNSKAHAIGIGTMPLLSHVSGQTFEIILSNVLLSPEFRISLISVNRLASASLSTSFPANSNACYVRKDKNTILVANH